MCCGGVVIARQVVKAWGLQIATQKAIWQSDTVTVVVITSHIDKNKIVKVAQAKNNLSLGVGLNKVVGKVFQISHLESLNKVKDAIISLVGSTFNVSR